MTNPYSLKGVRMTEELKAHLIGLMKDFEMDMDKRRKLGELEQRIEKVVDRLIVCDRAETDRYVVKLKALWAERRSLLGDTPRS
jgi:hypothetical protein